MTHETPDTPKERGECFQIHGIPPGISALLVLNGRCAVDHTINDSVQQAILNAMVLVQKDYDEIIDALRLLRGWAADVVATQLEIVQNATPMAPAEYNQGMLHLAKAILNKTRELGIVPPPPAADPEDGGDS